MEEEEEAPGLDPGTSTPTPSTRCQSAGMALCVDFEDMPQPTDGITPKAVITATNVLPQLRSPAETAAELSSTSLLRIADISKLDIPTNLTIEMWTMPTEVPSDSGDGKVGLFETHLQYAMSFEADRDIECSINVDERLDSAVQLSINAWHHVACTYDGAELRVYVDGRLRGCRETSATISNQGTFGAAIGANMDIGPTYKNPFVGQLDNVHLYSSTLTAAEICALWGNGNCDDKCPTGKGSSGSWDSYD